MTISDSEAGAKASRAALRLLHYRPRSRAELRERLARRFPTPAVEEALAHLHALGLVDDAAFARFWRQSREASPRSRFLLEKELRDKGVAPEIAREAAAGLEDEVLAYRAARKRGRVLAGLPEAAFRRRLGSYLLRRGFSLGLAQRTVGRLWKEGVGAVSPNPEENEV